MFTGIIEDVGKVVSAQKRDFGLTITVEHNEIFSKPAEGASIAINGVCLTQSDWKLGMSTFDIVEETLSKTNLGDLKVGQLVNIERSLCFGSRVEGHLVQGHVDGVGSVYKIRPDHTEIFVRVPQSMKTYLIYKGSITVDGVSLTVASLEEEGVRLALVPHTLEKTNLKEKIVGSLVNLEIDMFAKYTFKYLENREVQEVL